MFNILNFITFDEPVLPQKRYLRMTEVFFDIAFYMMIYCEREVVTSFLILCFRYFTWWRIQTFTCTIYRNSFDFWDRLSKVSFCNHSFRNFLLFLYSIIQSLLYYMDVCGVFCMHVYISMHACICGRMNVPEITLPDNFLNYVIWCIAGHAQSLLKNSSECCFLIGFLSAINNFA